MEPPYLSCVNSLIPLVDRDDQRESHCVDAGTDNYGGKGQSLGNRVNEVLSAEEFRQGELRRGSAVEARGNYEQVDPVVDDAQTEDDFNKICLCYDRIESEDYKDDSSDIVYRKYTMNCSVHYASTSSSSSSPPIRVPIMSRSRKPTPVSTL